MSEQFFNIMDLYTNTEIREYTNSEISEYMLPRSEIRLVPENNIVPFSQDNYADVKIEKNTVSNHFTETFNKKTQKDTENKIVKKDWLDLKLEIEKHLSSKLNEYFSKDVIDFIIEKKEPTVDKIDIKDFDKKLEELIKKRENINEDFKEIEKLLPKIKEKNYGKTIIERFQNKYNINLPDLREKQILYIETLKNLACLINTKKNEIKEYNKEIDSLYQWILSAPTHYKKRNIDIDKFRKTLLSPIEDYLTEINYGKKLEDFFNLRKDFLILASDCPNLFLEYNICNICVDKKITHCLNPCGHLYCGDCLSQNRDNKCPMCRTRYISKIKLHFN
jgi:hypothetical protein